MARSANEANGVNGRNENMLIRNRFGISKRKESSYCCHDLIFR